MKFTCFLDQYVGEAGREDSCVDPQGAGRASMLVVVASKQSTQSAAVREEIRIFRGSRRPILLIAFGDEEVASELRKLTPCRRRSIARAR